MSNHPFTIMIVDDLAENRLLLEVMLEDRYNLTHASDGEDCLQQVAAEAPDLILLDVTMPGLDGLEVCRQIKSSSDSANIPVIFVSARVSPEERLEGFEAGGDDYVTKPVNETDLLKKITDALAVSSQNQEVSSAVDDAMKIAMEAMVSSSELGTVNQFMRDCSKAESYGVLADVLTDVTRNFGLNCSFQFRMPDQVLNFGCDADSLDAKLLEKSLGGEKITDFQHRTVVSTPLVGILIKNMPVGEEAKYGRLKDHLSVLVDAVENKIEALLISANLEQNRAKMVEDLIEHNNEQLAQIRQSIEERETERREIMTGLLRGVEEQLFSLGLDEDQENHLMEILDSRVQQVNNLADFGEEIEKSFSSAREKLRSLLWADIEGRS